MTLMTAVGTVPARAGSTGGFRHACNGLAAAFCKEIRNLALDVLAAALGAGHGQVGLGHGAQGFEFVAAIFADIFVYGHGHLYKITTKVVTTLVTTFYSFLLAVEIGRDLTPGAGVPL